MPEVDYAAVIADLEAKKAQLEAAIMTLKGLLSERPLLASLESPVPPQNIAPEDDFPF